MTMQNPSGQRGFGIYRAPDNTGRGGARAAVMRSPGNPYPPTQIRPERRLSNRLQRPIPLVLQHRTAAHIILKKAGAGDRNDEKVFADHKRIPGRLGGARR